MTRVLILIALFIAITSSMAKAGNEKWVQDIRDEISEFEAIKNENVDVANHHKAWDYAIMAAELAEKRYTSALKKSLEAQNRIDSRSWLYDLDYYVRKYSNQALLDIFSCKNKAWTEKNLSKMDARMVRTPTEELGRSKRRLAAVESAISCYVNMYTNLSSRKKSYYGSRADDKMATDELYVLRNYDLPQAKMAVKYTTEFIAAIDPYMPHAIYEVFPGWVNHDMMGYRYTQDCDDKRIRKVFIVLDGISGVSHWSGIQDLTSGDMAWPLQKVVNSCGMVILPLSSRSVDSRGVSRIWGFSLQKILGAEVEQVKAIINTIDPAMRIFLMRGTDDSRTAEAVLASLKIDRNHQRIAGLVKVDKDTGRTTITYNRDWFAGSEEALMALKIKEIMIVYNIRRFIMKWFNKTGHV